MTSVTYTMPASTLPVSTWSARTSRRLEVTGLTLMAAFLNTLQLPPARHLRLAQRDLGGFLRQVGHGCHLPGLLGGPRLPWCSREILRVGRVARLHHRLHVRGAAEANTSAGAPLVIWVDKPELGPKLNFTCRRMGGVELLPSWVKVPISDAAAKTVIDPVGEAELLALDDEFPEPLLNNRPRRLPPAGHHNGDTTHCYPLLEYS